MERDKKTKAPIKGAHSAEFMLKEYERISTLWMDEVRQAEQRVNYFLTIASAGIGAIILLAQSSTMSKESVFFISESILVILLLFGVIFINRIILRGAQEKAFRNSLTEISNYFARQDPEIQAYLEIQRKVYLNPPSRIRIVSIILTRFRGDILDILILANGLICGGIVLLALSNSGSVTVTNILAGAISTIIVSIGIFYTYVLIMREHMVVSKRY